MMAGSSHSPDHRALGGTGRALRTSGSLSMMRPGRCARRSTSLNPVGQATATSRTGPGGRSDACTLNWQWRSGPNSSPVCVMGSSSRPSGSRSCTRVPVVANAPPGPGTWSKRSNTSTPTANRPQTAASAEGEMMRGRPDSGLIWVSAAAAGSGLISRSMPASPCTVSRVRPGSRARTRRKPVVCPASTAGGCRTSNRPCSRTVAVRIESPGAGRDNLKGITAVRPSQRTVRGE